MAKNVLIVDNAPEYRELLTQVVTAMGHNSRVSASGPEAWRMLQAEPADLVLLDMKMPAVHGDLFLQYIRSKGCRAPVMAISGYLTPGVVESLMKSGVERVIAKPFTVRRLATEIHEILGEDDG